LADWIRHKGLTGLSEYREDMLIFAKEVNDTYKTQKMTDKQRDHRISFDEVKEKVEKLLVGLKQHKTMQGFEQFLAGTFSSGVYAPPRRSEFANVRINNYDRRVDNYWSRTRLFSMHTRLRKDTTNRCTRSLPKSRRY
jgi:hypothetical protein